MLKSDIVWIEEVDDEQLESILAHQDSYQEQELGENLTYSLKEQMEDHYVD